MKKLKVVVIGGYAHIGPVLDDMVDMAEAELVAYAPALEGEDLAAVTDHPLCNENVKRFDDYHEMLRRVKPDVAVVSTRLDRIAPTSIAAAQAGCHLICEKPLAVDHDSLAALQKAVKDNNVRLIAMLQMRSIPAFIAARQLYQDGAIGEAVLVNGRKSYKWGTRPDWYGIRAQYGGTIGWVGIHALDFINYITGCDFVTVAAMQGNGAHPELSRCEDNCALLLGLSNGAHATVSIDMCRPEAAATHGDDWIRIVGTKGVIEAAGSGARCELINDQGHQNIPLPEPIPMFGDFLRSLLGKGDCVVGDDDSFMLTHVALCARDAADTGTVVKINGS